MNGSDPSSRGRRATAGRRTQNALALTCDTPHGSGTRFAIGAAFDVSGWALGPDPVTAVVVELDGQRASAEIAIASPDVAAAFPDASHAAHARFQARMTLAPGRRGPGLVAVRACDAAGREVTRHVTLELQPFTAMPEAASLAEAAALGPLLICDQPRLGGEDPTWAGGSAVGWAYAAGGLEQVLLVVDRRTSYPAVLGLWRGDVARELGREDATDAGWLVHVPVDACPPGEHEIAVIAVACDGRATGLVGTVAVLDGSALTAPTAATLETVADPHLPRLRAAGELGVPAEHRAAVTDVERMARYRWLAPLAQGAATLDVGCGEGLGCEFLQRAGAKALLGLDRDAGALARAAARDLRDIRFAARVADVLPCGDRSFDLVVAVGENFDQAGLQTALPELRRVLAPRGVLVICGRGIAAALAREFAHVRVARQRTGLLSEVTVDGEAEGDRDPPASWCDRDPTPSQADDLVELVACSPRPMRGLPPVVARGDPLAVAPWRAHAATWTRRALRAEAAIEAGVIDASWSAHYARLIAIRLQESERQQDALRRRVAELDQTPVKRLRRVARGAAGRARRALQR